MRLEPFPANDPARPAHRHVIDVLRAVAALSVCLYHFGGSLAVVGDVSPAIQTITSRGYLGVPVFFVISGFVIPLSMGDWRLSWASCQTFLARRLLRLYPPYLIASLLGVAVWGLSSLAPGFRGSPPNLGAVDFLASASMTAAFFQVPWLLVVAWTLAIEVQFYLAIAFVLPMLLNVGASVRVLVLGAWIALPLAFDHEAFLTSYSPLFGMGLVSFLHVRRRIGLGHLIAVLLAATVVHIRTHGLESSLAGLATTVALFASPRPSRIAAYLGAVSYSLYLVHVPIGGRIVNLGLRLPDFPYRGVVVMGAAIAGSLLAADWFHRAIEEQWIKRSKNVGRARTTTQEKPRIEAIEEVQTA